MTHQQTNNQMRIVRNLGLFALMLAGSIGVQAYLAPSPSRSMASVDPAVIAKSTDSAASSLKKSVAKPKDLPAPTVGWVQWDKFDQIANRLNKAGVTDTDRLNLMKSMSLFLTRNLKSLTPEQVRRSLATITDDTVRLEALENLAGATRYNSSDIPTMTQPFNTLKDDAHVLLVGMGGLGGYQKPN